jgi:3-phosphoshikimate 1-carboxyvinyltransferase
VNSVESADGRTVNLTPGRPSTMTWRILGDPSQGAFFAVLGAIHRDAEVDVLSLDDSPERIGYVGVLRRMGARISLERADHAATLRSRSSDLVATEVFAAEIPSLDEVPILAVAAAAATGISAFRDMSELRIKESDRLAGSMQLVAALGCRTWCERDDFFVEGLGTAGNFQAFSLAVGLDHRMVMSSAVAAVAGRGGAVLGAETVASSYPHFFDDLVSLA